MLISLLLITRLEESIELAGDYPYVLRDLNYVRDSFSDKVPYPLVFFYQIMRLEDSPSLHQIFGLGS